MSDVRALEEDRDHLLRSLRDLERGWEAGDLEERDYLALKEDYTARAAAVLRAIEASAAPPPAPPPFWHQDRTPGRQILVPERGASPDARGGGRRWSW